MSQNNNYYDCLVVGGGFAGIHQLYHLRKIGLSVKLLEAGGDLGGAWHWNTYPGDSELPIYQFSDPELWKDWTFSERYPGWKEIHEYFKYVDNKYDIKRDAFFNSRVVSAVWDISVNQWTVTTEDNRVFQAQFLSLCTGLTSKYRIPNFVGIESFKGQIHHTARWPTECDFKGKRVGVIGTGASAVQIIQEIASEVGHLTVFQRTPNLSLPMGQENISAQEQKKDFWPPVFDRCYQTFAVFPYDLDPNPTFSVPPEERIKIYEEKWAKGTFEFWLGNYADIFTDQKANDEVYAFWRKKTLERISHLPLEAQEKLAPEEAPHPFGIKRPCLEQGYFEIFSRNNVNLVDINKNMIQMITPNGVKTNDGVEHELDILIFATGFDMLTGGIITNIDIRGQDGISIKEKWETDGVRSHLGLAAATYPNMFLIFGPQSPIGNAPSVIEYMSEWIVNCIKYMKENNFSSIVATEEAQNAYTKKVDELGAAALWTKAARSWYFGTNIKGKRKQMLRFTGGFPAYDKLCNDSVEKGYEGFDLIQS